jgi:hypothetical protein
MQTTKKLLIIQDDILEALEAYKNDTGSKSLNATMIDAMIAGLRLQGYDCPDNTAWQIQAQKAILEVCTNCTN